MFAEPPEPSESEFDVVVVVVVVDLVDDIALKHFEYFFKLKRGSGVIPLTGQNSRLQVFSICEQVGQF